MPEAVLKEAKRELDRLANAAGRCRTRWPDGHIDWLIAVPWVAHTDEVIDLPQTKATLDADHSGIERSRTASLMPGCAEAETGRKGPILCFVGPPGVGKTSLARSIANAIGRKFVRVSLGGMRDEAEIRGHRREHRRVAWPDHPGTPRAGVKNPVFILDEIDKLGSDFRGDPASALLEVLIRSRTPSSAITTWTCRSTCRRCSSSRPPTSSTPSLRRCEDRMEVIELACYTEREKLAIAMTIWWLGQVTNHGLSPATITFEDEALIAVIAVTPVKVSRNLEREIGSICRKIARRHAEGDTTPITITAEMVETLLGAASPAGSARGSNQRTRRRDWIGVDPCGRRRS